jgi:hypothetical protein
MHIFFFAAGFPPVVLSFCIQLISPSFCIHIDHAPPPCTYSLPAGCCTHSTSLCCLLHSSPLPKPSASELGEHSQPICFQVYTSMQICDGSLFPRKVQRLLMVVKKSFEGVACLAKIGVVLSTPRTGPGTLGGEVGGGAEEGRGIRSTNMTLPLHQKISRNLLPAEWKKHL